MQTQLDRLQKQLLLGTEINAIIKQSTKLIEIVTANQKEVNKLKASNQEKLEREVA
jgi:hypothetical protein